MGFEALMVMCIQWVKTFECMLLGINFYYPNLPIMTNDEDCNDLIAKMVAPIESRGKIEELIASPFFAGYEKKITPGTVFVTPPIDKINISKLINDKMHYLLISWLLDVCISFKIKSIQAVFLMIHNMGRSYNALLNYLDPKLSLQAFGAVNLYLADRVYNKRASMEELTRLSVGAFTYNQMYVMLQHVLNELNGIINVPTYWDNCISGNNLDVLLKETIKWTYPNDKLCQQLPTTETKFVNGVEFLKEWVKHYKPLENSSLAVFMASDAPCDISIDTLRIEPISIPIKTIQEIRSIVEANLKAFHTKVSFFSRRDNYGYIYSLRGEMAADAKFANEIFDAVVNCDLIDSYDIVYGVKKLQAFRGAKMTNFPINSYTSSIEEMLDIHNSDVKAIGEKLQFEEI